MQKLSFAESERALIDLCLQLGGEGASTTVSRPARDLESEIVAVLSSCSPAT